MRDPERPRWVSSAGAGAEVSCSTRIRGVFLVRESEAFRRSLAAAFRMSLCSGVPAYRCAPTCSDEPCSGVPEFRRSGVPMPYWMVKSREAPTAWMFVGDKESALEKWSGETVGIVNCADQDYDFAPGCDRWWLNLNFRGQLNGRSWWARFEACVKFCLNYWVLGYQVLIHCKQDKHRSGAFCSCLCALLDKATIQEGMQTYFAFRRLGERDQRIVGRMCTTLELQRVLDSYREDDFCAKELRILRTRRPAPKRAPRPKASSLLPPPPPPPSVCTCEPDRSGKLARFICSWLPPP